MTLCGAPDNERVDLSRQYIHLLGTIRCDETVLIIRLRPMIAPEIRNILGDMFGEQTSCGRFTIDAGMYAG